MVKVISERCPKNHPCPMVRKCPKGAISQKGFDAPAVDPSKCVRCGLCIRTCPYSCFQQD